MTKIGGLGQRFKPFASRALMRRIAVPKPFLKTVATSEVTAKTTDSQLFTVGISSRFFAHFAHYICGHFWIFHSTQIICNVDNSKNGKRMKRLTKVFIYILVMVSLSSLLRVNKRNIFHVIIANVFCN